MEIFEFLKSKSELIERHLDFLLPEKNVPYNQLYKAARYALLDGGKRLRPILTLATVETLKGSQKNALSPACALEMVHTYSLIHDDLPCMDDDDFRRGKPSLHKAFPEGLAVLTGDFLLTYAFEVILNDPLLNADQKVKLTQVLSKYSGGEGMIAGQVMDIDAEGKNIDIEALQNIHRRKTGAMIKASIEFGGIIANASNAEMESLRQYGDLIGLAFQIIDDLLDVTASTQKHGKATSSDAANNKMTFATLLGIDQSKKIADSLLEKAKSHLNTIDGNTKVLNHLSDYLVNRSY